MAYDLQFIEECLKDHSGEAMVTRARLRMGSGGSLYTLTDREQIIAASPVQTRLQRDFGVVQGQAFSLKFSHENKDFSVSNADSFRYSSEMIGKFVVIEAGFPGIGFWRSIAQGVVTDVDIGTDMTAVIEVEDATMRLLGGELQRDMMWSEENWSGAVKVKKLDEGNESYDNNWDGNDGGTVVQNPTGSSHVDGTYTIEFTGTSAYKVIRPNLSEQTGGTLGADFTVNDGSSNDLFIIKTDGWPSGATYSSGDQFVVYTSAKRTAFGAVDVIMEIIDDLLGVQVFDVASDAYYSTPFYDKVNTWDQFATDYATYKIRGFWEKGSSTMVMVQDALKLLHGSIYPSFTGQLSLWIAGPDADLAGYFRGRVTDPNTQTNIIKARRKETSRELVNFCTYSYKNWEDGGDGEVESEDTGSQTDYGLREKRVSTGWWTPGSVAQTAADRMIVRKKDPGILLDILSTLPWAMTMDPGEFATVVDDELPSSYDHFLMTSKTVDVRANEVHSILEKEPLTDLTFARVDFSTCGSTDVIG